MDTYLTPFKTSLLPACASASFTCYFLMAKCFCFFLLEGSDLIFVLVTFYMETRLVSSSTAKYYKSDSLFLVFLYLHCRNRSLPLILGKVILPRNLFIVFFSGLAPVSIHLS